MFRSAALAAVSLACSACGERSAGNNPPARETTAAVAACDLLVREEIVQVLQASVGEPQAQIISMVGPDRAGISQCVYTTEGAPRKSIALFLRQSPAKDNDPDAIRGTLATAGITVSDVAGLGEAAFWGAGQLHVFHGGQTYFSLDVSGMDSDAQALEGAKTLATAVLTRLGGP